MATYECNKYGMSVNASCWKCDEKLLNDLLGIENVSVQISKCPKGHGKIKKPLCCGQDLTCTLWNFNFSEDRNFWIFILLNNYNFYNYNSCKFINKNHNKTII